MRSICFFRCICVYVFFFKQKTAYEMRISDWSSDVCSSDLRLPAEAAAHFGRAFDLIVVGQPDPEPKDPLAVPPGVDVLPHELAIRAGRPILTIPYAGKAGSPGQRVKIGRAHV